MKENSFETDTMFIEIENSKFLAIGWHGNYLSAWNLNDTFQEHVLNPTANDIGPSNNCLFLYLLFPSSSVRPSPLQRRRPAAGEGRQCDSNSGLQRKYLQQGCIPVGCVPPAC